MTRPASGSLFPGARLVFAAVAVALATATHWPKLKVPGPEGTDLVIHMASFGAWTIALACCGFFGPALERRSILVGVPAALAYAGLDELTQAFSPGRVVTWADFGANALGVAAASLLLLIVAPVIRRAIVR